MNQVDGVSYMVATAPCVFVGRGLSRGAIASPTSSVLVKAVPHLSPWCQTLQSLPVCHCGLSSCCPGAGAQQQWVWVSPCTGALRGTAWESSSFFHQLILHWFLQPEAIGIYLSSTGTVGWAAWCGAVIPHSQGIPPNFYLPHMDVGLVHSVSLCFCISAPPISLYGCTIFFNFVFEGPPFNFCWYWLLIFIYFSCTFDVVVWGGKYRVYLGHHLGDLLNTTILHTSNECIKNCSLK